jgi:hypothetical protein
MKQMPFYSAVTVREGTVLCRTRGYGCNANGRVHVPSLA